MFGHDAVHRHTRLKQLMESTQHSFVVPAFGESPHLGECLASLTAQTVASAIIVATPTPNEAIASSASVYGARLVVNAHGGGIGPDWNFALSCADTPWVTIAHQDDIYLPEFTSRTMSAALAHDDVSLVLTGYAELVGNDTRTSTSLLRIKRALLELGFLGGTYAGSRMMKTNALRFGCAIPCPSVTLRVDREPFAFREDLRIDLDWEAWLRLARLPGRFAFVREISMLHRVHPDSETSAGIADGARLREDLEVLCQMWPAPIARMIASTYGLAYRSNMESQ